LAQALSRDLHGSTVDGLYQVARSLCVHRVEDLDAFDRAFASYFEGVTDEAIAITAELAEWLADPAARRQPTDQERRPLESADLDEAMRQLRQRLAEQRERHDRGTRWVGTGGASPFGRSGEHPSGIRVGDGISDGRGGRGGAIALAGERRFRALRGDITL